MTDATRAPHAIRLTDVSKRFGRTRALDRASFAIAEGEVVGFVGPNGAGKTTALRIMCGFLDPDHGRVEVAGHDVVTARTRARENIGYMPESVPVYRDMRVDEYLKFRARLKRVPRAAMTDRLAAAIERAGLADHRRAIISRLSKGYRQRVGLADALIAEPPVVLLDEPMAGLDPMQVRDFRALIRELAGRHTVVLSSHVLPEIEAIAERVIMVASGRVIADGALDALREAAGCGASAPLDQVFIALAEASEESDEAGDEAGEESDEADEAGEESDETEASS